MQYAWQTPSFCPWFLEPKQLFSCISHPCLLLRRHLCETSLSFPNSGWHRSGWGLNPQVSPLSDLVSVCVRMPCAWMNMCVRTCVYEHVFVHMPCICVWYISTCVVCIHIETRGWHVSFLFLLLSWDKVSHCRAAFFSCYLASELSGFIHLHPWVWVLSALASSEESPISSF